MTLTTGEFIRRFLIHVLPKGFHRIRHFGLFANHQRKQNLQNVRQLLGEVDANPDPQEEKDKPPTFVCRIKGHPHRLLIASRRARGYVGFTPIGNMALCSARRRFRPLSAIRAEPIRRVRNRCCSSDQHATRRPHTGVVEDEVGILILLAQKSFIEFGFLPAIDRRPYAGELRQREV